jgi:hypothetical protein
MASVREKKAETRVGTERIREHEFHPRWAYSRDERANLFRGLVAYFHVHEGVPFFSPMKRHDVVPQQL